MVSQNGAAGPLDRSRSVLQLDPAANPGTPAVRAG